MHPDHRAGHLKAPPDALGDFGGRFERSGNNRGEFFAAEPSNEVGGAHGGAGALRKNAQDLVASGVAKSVVD